MTAIRFLYLISNIIDKMESKMLVSLLLFSKREIYVLKIYFNGSLKDSDRWERIYGVIK